MPAESIEELEEEEETKVRGKSFLPLLHVANKEQKWILYRDYLFALLEIEAS